MYIYIKAVMMIFYSYPSSPSLCLENPGAASRQCGERERKQESPFKSKLQMQVTLVEAPRGGRFLSTRAGPGGLASPAWAPQLPPRTPPVREQEGTGGGTGCTPLICTRLVLAPLNAATT